MAEKSGGNLLRTRRRAATITAAALTLSTIACGGADKGVSGETTTPKLDLVADPCVWTLTNRRPLISDPFGNMGVVIDSRCTSPANDPTGIYLGPNHEAGKELRDKAGLPVSVASGTIVVADCVKLGDSDDLAKRRVQNDNRVGEEWYVKIKAPVDDGFKEGYVPSIHVGLPPHHGLAQMPEDSSLPLC